jgi:hypothetical protein
MLKIKVFKIQKYSYHENTLPWKDISYPGPYQFNYNGKNLWIPSHSI